MSLILEINNKTMFLTSGTWSKFIEMKQITRDANVQELIKTFELEQPKIHKIETSDYHLDERTGYIIIKV